MILLIIFIAVFNIPGGKKSGVSSGENTLTTTVIAKTGTTDPTDEETTKKSNSHTTQQAEITTKKSATATTGKVTSPSDWNMILINKNNWLPSNFSVDLAYVDSNYQVDKRIVDKAKKMISDAKAEGVSLVVCSAYRSVKKQTELFNNKVETFLNQGYKQTDAEVKAATITARPRTSEHHTGLAMDIVTKNYMNLDDGYADTAAAKWLYRNAYKYGFILRYPKDKQSVTNVIFEPWHYRYVGEAAANEIKTRGICLEEYLNKLD
ncbi:MAG: hypothetical protein BGN88_14935 [Clostridiales bacterium 43-6]|nr:MAG: hypothetical protein BGN88_14935 [Clostridiales bacterium 43-6]